MTLQTDRACSEAAAENFALCINQRDGNLIEAARLFARSLFEVGVDESVVLDEVKTQLTTFGGEEASQHARTAVWLAAHDRKDRSTTPTGNGEHAEATGWPEPQTLVAAVEPEPYPVDALPGLIRGAVEEVQAFTKAPIAMVASSAIGAVSVAAQAYVDVQRAPKLTGPSSVYLLTIGESGERKSTCDDYFTVPIQEYEKRQLLAMAPEVADYRANLDAWTAKRNGLLDKIRAGEKSDKPTDEAEVALRYLERDKPKPLRVPRLLRGDDTPENLAWELSQGWPSAGVLSSEAGLILGAHGMNKETIMRHLSLLNILWDGRDHSIGRRTSESFTVHGVRFTVALLVQEATLRHFFEQSGRLARGIGFFARFLVAWPTSTQGYRSYADPPSQWPHLAAYHHRLENILDVPPAMDDNGALTPTMLVLSPPAKAAWIEYHNEIESQLRSGGELHDVRDVASKSADNAARLAALFHAFERGGGGAIGADVFDGASRIAAWHLNESRRFFGEMAMPIEVSGAMRLGAWLLDYCHRERIDTVPVAAVQKCGPSGLRSKAAMESAVRELSDLHRVRLNRRSHPHSIAVNPALLTGSKTARTAETATAESRAEVCP